MHFEQGKLHCTVRPGNGLETVSPCDFRGRRNEGDFRRRYEDISRAVRKKSAPCDSRGGHVSCPVAHIAKMLDFHVTVMDDRKEFLTKNDSRKQMNGFMEALRSFPKKSRLMQIPIMW